MTVSTKDVEEVRLALEAAARERILVLDGAMGTMIQAIASRRNSSAGSASPIGRATCAATTTC